jgi:chromosome segregation ATPase
MEEVHDLAQARRLVTQLRGRVDELRQQEAHWKAQHDAVAGELAQVRAACTGLRTELSVVRRELATYLEDQPRRWEIEREHGQFLTTIRELQRELAEVNEGFAVYRDREPDRITEQKARDIAERTGMERVGYVLQAESGEGGACIVHRGAVRWLSDGELWDVVHPPQGGEDE